MNAEMNNAIRQHALRSTITPDATANAQIRARVAATMATATPPRPSAMSDLIRRLAGTPAPEGEG